MRTSLTQKTQAALTYINNASSRLLDAQTRAITGKRITKASDDVAGTGRALSLRSAIRTTEQYSNNIDVSQPLVSATESALSDLTDLVQEVRTIAVAAASTGSSGDKAEAYVAELTSILSQMVDVANTQHSGQYVFSGTATDTPAVGQVGGETSYSYTGNSGVKTTQVLSWVTLPMNIPGSTVFNFDQSAGEDTTDIFAMVTQLTDAINGGNGEEISAQLDNIDANLDNLLSSAAHVGSWDLRMQGAGNTLLETKDRLTELLSDTEDVDLTQAVVELKTQENVYQAALSVTSEILSLSLASLDYLSS